VEFFASVLGLPLCGKLIGLSHDLGKYSKSFQDYICAVTGLLGEQAKQAGLDQQGRIDHATSGAQLVWGTLNGDQNRQLFRIMAQLLSVAVMSHHSRAGMADFISLDGKSPFLRRLAKSEESTHLREVQENANPAILSEINKLLESPEIIDEFKNLARRIKTSSSGKTIRYFNFSLLARFLFSCLLDADRLNTANFENRKAARFRTTGQIPDWSGLVEKLEAALSKFDDSSSINQIRHQISGQCRAAATRSGQLFSLAVPTGGGKTLASLRFALHRAASDTPHPVERIIYIVPYTSIIDQNADDVRKILGEENVLEHHSNIAPERDTWRNRVLSENWDAPVVFTTSVQFLESLFAQGTRTARRMHQLSNAILVFDEIQALPIKTIHCFNNAINFLAIFANTTVLLCTATMPLLHRVNPKLGALDLRPECEIIADKKTLFAKLKRTQIIDKRKSSAWKFGQIKDFALECLQKHKSVLVVCNTKKSARILFEQIRETRPIAEIVHLSTLMCPAHRLSKIKRIKSALTQENPTPVICISTQLIEAGVDLDFGCVIRSLAGFDSIVQAAGRCNRHGHRDIGPVYIVDFADEILGPALAEIATAQRDTERVLREFHDNPASLGNDLLSEQCLNRFYEYHFHKRASEMLYPLKAGSGTPPIEADTSILALLSENPAAREAAIRENASAALSLPLPQAFSTAAQAFRVIDAPTNAILVPYGGDGHDGTKLIANLSAAYANENYPLAKQVALMREAQQYSVNAFPHTIETLRNNGALNEIQQGTEIYCLDERFYNDDLGVTTEPTSSQNFLQV